MDKFGELSKLVKEKGKNCGGGLYIFTNKIEGNVYEIGLFDDNVVRSTFNQQKFSIYKNNTATIFDGKKEKKGNPTVIYSMLLTMILGRAEAAKKLQENKQSIEDKLAEMNDQENKFKFSDLDFKFPLLFGGFLLVLFLIYNIVVKFI